MCDTENHLIFDCYSLKDFEIVDLFAEIDIFFSTLTWTVQNVLQEC